MKTKETNGPSTVNSNRHLNDNDIGNSVNTTITSNGNSINDNNPQSSVNQAASSSSTSSSLPTSSLAGASGSSNSQPNQAIVDRLRDNLNILTTNRTAVTSTATLSSPSNTSTLAPPVVITPHRGSSIASLLSSTNNLDLNQALSNAPSPATSNMVTTN